MNTSITRTLFTVGLASTLTLSMAQKTNSKNPLLQQSTVAYGAPDFNKVCESDYLPALQAAIAEARANIKKISIDNMVENSIRPLAIGRKNYLFCGDDDAAQRAAVVYSLLATCKARGIDERAWLEAVLRRIPQYELGKTACSDLLPGNWKPVTK